jgi:hypothetical protein
MFVAGSSKYRLAVCPNLGNRRNLRLKTSIAAALRVSLRPKNADGCQKIDCPLQDQVFDMLLL